MKIAILTLDSLYSGSSLHKLVEAFPEDIVLLCGSKRYAGNYGGFFHQLKKNLRRSGISFVNYLTLHHLAYAPMVYITDVFNLITGREKKVYTIGQLARKHNIPLIKTGKINSKEPVEALKKANPDLIISAYFDQVIREPVIEIARAGVINVHTALLPNFKGPFPTLWPLIMGKNEVGVTLHYVNDSKLDTGPILRQKHVDFITNESVLSADCRFYEEAINELILLIRDLKQSGAVEVSPQTEGSYYSFPSKEDIQLLNERGHKLYKLSDFFRQFS